ncbi:MAG: SPASM domain-containing protein [Desulfomonilaceae bacterium]
MAIIPTNRKCYPGLCSSTSLIFGDINDQSLSTIWRQKAYRAFRRHHAKGSGTDCCGDCAKLFCPA